MAWWNYPEPKTPQLTDDQRNQMRDLAHEACEAHCDDCGACILEVTASTVRMGGDVLCEDCAYA